MQKGENPMSNVTSNAALNVAKFGGTSVADHEAMLRCANIIKSQPETRVVVVSASAGVTNHLVTLSQKLLSAEQQTQIIEEIRAIQYNITRHLDAENELNQTVDEILAKLSELAVQQNTLQTAKTGDSILACGEQMSSIIFAEVLRSIDVQGLAFDVRDIMRTNSLYGKAVVDLEALATNAQQQLVPLLENNVIVTQGFIGQDGLGNTTTLGRGGSDYSAALIAEAIKSQGLAIWTDVVGIFTTDPRNSKKPSHVTCQWFFGTSILYTC